MRIVINKCYGGFGYSDKLVERLLELGMTSTVRKPNGIEYVDPHADFVHREDSLLLLGDSHYSYIQDSGMTLRTDERFIQAVEEMGEEANTDFSKLKVIEIPDDVGIDDIEVDEYDGIEWVREKSRTWE